MSLLSKIAGNIGKTVTKGLGDVGDQIKRQTGSPVYSPAPPVPSPAAVLLPPTNTPQGLAGRLAAGIKTTGLVPIAAPMPVLRAIDAPTPVLTDSPTGLAGRLAAGIKTTGLVPIAAPMPVLRRIALAPPITAAEAPVSILSSIAKGANALINNAPRAIAAVTQVQNALRPSSTVPTGPMPMQPPGASLVATKIAGPLGGIAGALAGQLFGSSIGSAIQGYAGGAVASSGGCGCNGSGGRDPCTHQRSSSQPAPLATFFGGCCPPGRTLRRIAGGRDVCIKTPRMNVFNPRALARADRRVTSFARRAAPILKDMGYSVSRQRKVTLKVGKRKRGRR